MKKEKGNNKKHMAITILLFILSLACIFYGISIWMIRSGTAFFLVWFAIAALLLLSAFLTYKNKWNVIPSWIRISGCILILICMVYMILVHTLVFSHFSEKGKPDLDYIVVLGAQVKENGPSAVTKWRLEAAIDYLNANPETIAVVSGGQGMNEPAPEAVVMKKYMTEKGIDESRILTEERSRNTAENIEFSAKLFDIENDSIGIVTNNFHVYRGVAIAKHFGYKNVCGIAGASSRRYLPNNLLRESVGILKDFLCGNL